MYQVAKVWSLSISPSSEHAELISSRMDWLDLLAVQGILKNLLQHHSSKASVLQCSAFFTVQPSHLYMTTGNNIALIRRTFAGKIMSLLFNMLSRFVIAFLPRRYTIEVQEILDIRDTGGERERDGRKEGREGGKGKREGRNECLKAGRPLSPPPP